jgi:hypothetical protein
VTSGIDPRSVPLPRYGSAALSDLVPSALASIGTPGFDNVLDLPAAAAVAVLLVDGLGATALRAHAADAPLLQAALVGGGRDLTAGFPSTTAASIASIGTGRPPGGHGIVGYQMAIPGGNRLMNALRWDPSIEPMEWQPGATAFERAVAVGTTVDLVAKREFEGSGLSQAALRGGRFIGADVFGEVAADTLHALGTAVDSRRPGFVYAYVADLDWTGHGHGVGSQAWQLQLQLIDRLVEQIVSRLPAGARLYVTADHGMVDVPAGRRIDVDTDAELASGIELLGGEARARYLYVRPGALDDVMAVWQSRLDGEAVVCTRDEAIAAGWFGPVADWARARIGDIVVAVLSDLALVASHRHPREARLVGHHGSVTAAEQLVPLVPFGTG